MALASGMRFVFDRSGIPMRMKINPATMVGFGVCSMECCNLKLGVLLLCVLTIWGAAASGQPALGQEATTRFEGRVLDADSGEPLEARIYLAAEQNEWLFVQTAHDQGSAWPYAEQWVPMPGSIERHTTVSAHPFQIQLKPGRYTIEIERGKEYLPLRDTIVVPANPGDSETLSRTFQLKRWVNLAERGWYSGETHVHRRIVELPNVMRAEDLNVAFPVTFWTTRSDQIPDLTPSTLRSQGPSPFGPREDRGPEPIFVSSRHVILPRNTEYEIFSVGGKQHVLGALFVLNHKTPFEVTAPPIGPVIEHARRENALLDLDKHNWPWSLMLIPVAKVDLYELSNNSVWRTQFGFKQAGQRLPPWATIEQESPGILTEWGWLQFGFEMYYALLNCGFRLSPTAGTASGVHPVPLGHSRVYVHTGPEFDLNTWLEGLKAGRSFVTTGPILMAQIDGQHPGAVTQIPAASKRVLEWTAEVHSPTPITTVELVVNGEVRRSFQPGSREPSKTIQTAAGGWIWKETGSLEVSESGWAVFRTWTNLPDGRKRFAHTGAWYFEVGSQPIRPPRQQLDYLIEELEASMRLQKSVLPQDAYAEFETALDHYKSLLPFAKD